LIHFFKRKTQYRDAALAGSGEQPRTVSREQLGAK